MRLDGHLANRGVSGVKVMVSSSTKHFSAALKHALHHTPVDSLGVRPQIRVVKAAVATPTAIATLVAAS